MLTHRRVWGRRWVEAPYASCPSSVESLVPYVVSVENSLQWPIFMVPGDKLSFPFFVSCGLFRALLSGHCLSLCMHRDCVHGSGRCTLPK